jgi:hypothetical protein
MSGHPPFRARLARGIAALVTLLGVLIAVPAVLYAAGGEPLPGHVPSLAGIWHGLTTVDPSAHLFITSALTLAWLGWLAFVVSVVLEVVGRLRNRPAWRIPGLRLPQRAAAGLLTTVAVMLGSTGLAATAFAAGVPSAPAAVVSVQTPSAATAAPAATAATSSAAAPATGATSSAAATAASTAVTAPGHHPDQGIVYHVRHGDQLGSIAQRFLGSFDAYHRIEAMNSGLIRDPDYITPGWELHLPAGAYDRGPTAHATGRTSPAVGRPPVAPPGGPVTGGTTLDADAPLVTFGEPVPIPVDAALSTAAPHAPDRNHGNSPDLVLAAGVLTAGVLGAHLLVWRRRRRELGYGPVHGAHTAAGRRAVPALPDSELTGATAEINRLDLALRDLASLLGDRDPEQMPDIMGSWIVDGAVHLMLTRPCPAPPAPWRAKERMWTLPAHVPANLYFSGTAAPLPALVTIGGRQNRHMLLDLERLGVVSIGGDRGAAQDMLRHVGAELAAGIWSEGVQVGIAGFGHEETQQLLALGNGRIEAAGSIADALDTAYHWIDEAHHRMTGLGIADVLSGRVTRTPTEAARLSPYALLLAGPDAQDLERLERLDAYLAGLGRGQVAIATTTNADFGRFGLKVDRDHQVTMDFLDTQVPGVSLPDRELAALAVTPDMLRRNSGPRAAAEVPVGRHRPNTRQSVR